MKTSGASRGAGSKQHSSRTLWTAALALIVIFVVMMRLNGVDLPSYPSLIIGIAVVFLVVRQWSRRVAGKRPKAAEPDPRSRLNLN